MAVLGFKCSCPMRRLILVALSGRRIEIARLAKATSRRDPLFCATRKRQTSATAGTVLNGSKLPLRGWFLAL